MLYILFVCIDMYKYMIMFIIIYIYDDFMVSNNVKWLIFFCIIGYFML